MGRRSETSSKRREASLCLSQEKGSSGSACPRLLGAGPPASAQRTHPSQHLLLPATGLTTQTLQRKEQNTRFFFSSYLAGVISLLPFSFMHLGALTFITCLSYFLLS